MKTICIIPARGGSKGIPRKNIREIDGKPLIAFSIEAAKKSKYLDSVIVSSEDDEILSISKQLGAEILKRPSNLAQDTTPGADVVLHALNTYKDYDYVVLLQPTSPLRTVKFIDLKIRFFFKNSFSSLLSLKKIKNKVYNLKNKKCFSSKSMNYVSDGAIYICNTEYFLKNKKLISLNNGYIELPEKNNVDVDTLDDLNKVRKILKK